MSWHPCSTPANAVTDPPLDIRLNRQWRVTADSRQWILENRIGPGGWQERKFRVDRDGLIRRIGELCGPVNPEALRTIAAWDPLFAVWAARRNGWLAPA
jgi:hypothetical protein